MSNANLAGGWTRFPSPERSQYSLSDPPANWLLSLWKRLRAGGLVAKCTVAISEKCRKTGKLFLTHRLGLDEHSNNSCLVEGRSQGKSEFQVRFSDP